MTLIQIVFIVIGYYLGNNIYGTPTGIIGALIGLWVGPMIAGIMSQLFAWILKKRFIIILKIKNNDQGTNYFYYTGRKNVYITSNKFAEAKKYTLEKAIQNKNIIEKHGLSPYNNKEFKVDTQIAKINPFTVQQVPAKSIWTKTTIEQMILISKEMHNKQD